MTAITIAIDCMGGDLGPSVMIPSACKALAKYPYLSLILVGLPDRIEPELVRLDGRFSDRIKIKAASQIVDMSEKPSTALRKKKDSSMSVALTSVAEGEAQACVSAGNTGALMVLSRYILKMITGVSRPAITSTLPTEQGNTRLIDLGANVDCSAKQLYEFALMGSAMVSALEHKAKPKVGLLNIGSEAIKGNEQTKETAELLEQSAYLNYIGYVEGNDVYRGVADIIVCDGFVGNVLLKGSEGVARLLISRLRKEFERNFLTKLLSAIVMPVLQAFGRRINPDQYNGASFIGLQGIVIKSHGAANQQATLAAIEEAIREVENNVPIKIKDQLEEQLRQYKLL
ncbi:MAG: phosphate acyltransferase PlsX [Gammaproteobacteria bacterium]|nr:phosphate acyltransferase PlsX [Gammaproteobacteria bacterium]